MMSHLNSIIATHFVRRSLVHFYVIENYKRADNLRVVRCYMPCPLINSNLHSKEIVLSLLVSGGQSLGLFCAPSKHQ